LFVCLFRSSVLNSVPACPSKINRPHTCTCIQYFDTRKEERQAVII
jgi:hypothetical protein